MGGFIMVSLEGGLRVLPRAAAAPRRLEADRPARGHGLGAHRAVPRPRPGAVPQVGGRGQQGYYSIDIYGFWTIFWEFLGRFFDLAV